MSIGKHGPNRKMCMTRAGPVSGMLKNDLYSCYVYAIESQQNRVGDTVFLLRVVDILEFLEQFLLPKSLATTPLLLECLTLGVVVAEGQVVDD